MTAEEREALVESARQMIDEAIEERKLWERKYEISRRYETRAEVLLPLHGASERAAIAAAKADGIKLIPRSEPPHSKIPNVLRYEQWVDTPENRELLNAYVKEIEEYKTVDTITAEVFKPNAADLSLRATDNFTVGLDTKLKYDNIIFNRIDRDCDLRGRFGLTEKQSFSDLAMYMVKNGTDKQPAWLEVDAIVDSDKNVFLRAKAGNDSKIDIDDKVQLYGEERDLIISVIESSLEQSIDELLEEFVEYAEVLKKVLAKEEKEKAEKDKSDKDKPDNPKSKVKAESKVKKSDDDNFGR